MSDAAANFQLAYQDNQQQSPDPRPARHTIRPVAVPPLAPPEFELTDPDRPFSLAFDR